MINIDKVPGEGIGAANAIPDLEVVEFWNRVLNEDLSGVLINSPYFLPDTNKIFIENLVPTELIKIAKFQSEQRTKYIKTQFFP